MLATLLQFLLQSLTFFHPDIVQGEQKRDRHRNLLSNSFVLVSIDRSFCCDKVDKAAALQSIVEEP